MRPSPESTDDGELVEALQRYEQDPAFAARLRLAWQGNGSVLEALRRQADGTAADRLAAATIALYRREAGSEAADRRARMLKEHDAERRELANALAGTQRASANNTPADVPSLPPRRGSRAVAQSRSLLIVAFAVAGVITGVLALLQPHATAHRPDGLEDRALLPSAWQDSTVVAASAGLDGATPLAIGAPLPNQLLLAVQCPASDRSFQAVTTADGVTLPTTYGACGRQDALVVQVPSGTARLSVLVTVRGVEVFSAELLRR